MLLFGTFIIYCLLTEIVVLSKLINLKNNIRKNQSKPINKLMIPWKSRFQLREQQQNDNDDNVTLNLSTIASASSNQDDDEFDGTYSEWMELE